VVKNLLKAEVRMQTQERDSLGAFLVQVLRYVDVHEDVAASSLIVILDGVFSYPTRLADLSVEEAREIGSSARPLGTDLLIEMVRCRPENWSAVKRGLTAFAERSVPQRLTVYWDVARVCALVASLQGASTLEGAASVEYRAMVREVQGRLAASVTRRRSFDDLAKKVLLLELVPPGVIAERWMRAVLAELCNWRGEACLQVLARELLNEKEFLSDGMVAAAYFEEALAANVSLEFGSQEVARALEVATDNMDEPVDVMTLEQYNYRFEKLRSRPRIGTVAVLESLARRRGVDAQDIVLLTASLIRSLGGGDPEVAYMDALDPEFDWSRRQMRFRTDELKRVAEFTLPRVRQAVIIY
jgi:hypothetical protein